MLSVIEIQNFDVNKPTGYLLPKIFKLFYSDLRERITALIEKYSPVRLHNSRVAARRMEALLIGFDSLINKNNSKYNYDYTLNSIKEIIKILGASREYEVTYDLTLKYIKTNNSENQKSILLFLGDLRTNKNILIKNLYRNKYFLKYQGNLKKIEKYLDEYLLNNSLIDKLIVPFKEIYCDIISKHFSAFLGGIKKLNLLDSKNINKISSDKLHKFRISSKTFRYLLDMCTGTFINEFEEFRLTIKNTVEKLGEYHDYDVVINLAEKFLIDKISSTDLPSKAIIEYLRYSNQTKKIIFNEIVSLLKNVNENHLRLIKNNKIFL